MSNKPTKREFKKLAGKKAPANPLSRSKKAATSPSDQTVRVRGDFSNPRRSSSVVSKRETQLLGRINAGLSEPQASRLKSLDARRDQETLTPEEHAELLNLVDRSERLTLGRAEAVVELARLRGTTVRSLMNDLGLGVAGYG